MSAAVRTKRVYRCAACGRRLRSGRWIVGRDRRLAQKGRPRYCFPGEGCNR